MTLTKRMKRELGFEIGRLENDEDVKEEEVVDVGVQSPTFGAENCSKSCAKV
jgi:hypothetical protein